MNSVIASTIAHTLFHFLWEGALIALVLAVALYLLRPSSARVRYGLACVAMLSMLAAFGATLAWFWPHSEPVVIHSGATQYVLPVRPAFLGNDALTPPAGGNTLNWIAPLWVLGVLLFSLRSFTAWIVAMRLKRRGITPATAAWQATLAELAARIRISSPVTLVQSYLTDVPLVVGFLSPVILVPARLFLAFPADQLELILIHELAHIRRHDYLVNLLQSLAEDLLFYHPAVWWVSTVIRTERENCCDDVVVAAKGDALGFAEALAALEQHRWTAYEAALAANGGHLMNRIHRLLNRRERSRLVAPPTFSASLLLAATALAIAAIHAQPAPQAPQPLAPQAQAPAQPRPRAQNPTAPAPQPAAQAKPVPAVAPEPVPVPQTESEPSAAQVAKARRTLISELETPYKKWLNSEVVYIISAQERSAFESLTTDEERDMFIQQFWLRRDPDPNTPRNEYRDEHYRRIVYATVYFSTKDVAGWKTDRGMIYIKYGPPDEREQHPSGGVYERPPQEGGGQTVTYPFEKWHYRYLEAVGNNVNIEFVDPMLTGEFRMTKAPVERAAMLSCAEYNCQVILPVRSGSPAR